MQFESTIDRSTSLLNGPTQGDQKHHTLAGSVRGKKFRNVIIEKGEPRSAEALSVGREIQPPTCNARLELRRPIAAVAAAFQNLFEIAEKKQVCAAIGGNFLT